MLPIDGMEPSRNAPTTGWIIPERERRTIMAGGVNKVILVGHLGADPDMRYTPSGQGVCELRLATSESWNDKNGQRQERTEWHRIVVWGKRAEVCSKYLSKGRQVFVEGRIQTRTYDDKDGNKRYITEIIANDVQFLGGGRDGAGAGAGGGGSGGGGGARGGRSEEGPPPPADGDFGGYGGGGGGGGGGGPDDDIPF
jgi:single-strand DNA-binding protein